MKCEKGRVGEVRREEREEGEREVSEVRAEKWRSKKGSIKL